MSETFQIVLGGSAVVVFFLIVSLTIREKTEGMRQFLFYGMTAVIMFVTLFLTFETILKNRRSVTGGPVHWHADYLITICTELAPAVEGSQTIAHGGEADEHSEIDLVDPEGIANRVGNPLLHEHGDDRIHIEGTVDELANITLAKFFEQAGGRLTENEIAVPTNEGLLHLKNGDLCLDGQPGHLQVFLYKTEGNYVIQEKLTDFPNYVISPHSTVPPGDCLIFEFTAEEKTETENICDFYAIDLEQGKLELIEQAE